MLPKRRVFFWLILVALDNQLKLSTCPANFSLNFFASCSLFFNSTSCIWRFDGALSVSTMWWKCNGSSLVLKPSLFCFHTHWAFLACFHTSVGRFSNKYPQAVDKELLLMHACWGLPVWEINYCGILPVCETTPAVTLFAGRQCLTPALQHATSFFPGSCVQPCQRVHSAIRARCVRSIIKIALHSRNATSRIPHHAKSMQRHTRPPSFIF